MAANNNEMKASVSYRMIDAKLDGTTHHLAKTQQYRLAFSNAIQFAQVNYLCSLTKHNQSKCVSSIVCSLAR